MSFGSHLLSLSDGGIWSIQFCPSSNKHPHPHYSSAMRSINIHFMLQACLNCAGQMFLACIKITRKLETIPGPMVCNRPLIVCALCMPLRCACLRKSIAASQQARAPRGCEVHLTAVTQHSLPTWRGILVPDHSARQMRLSQQRCTTAGKARSNGAVARRVVRAALPGPCAQTDHAACTRLTTRTHAAVRRLRRGL